MTPISKIKPLEIDVQSYFVSIIWADRHESRYSMKLLRQHCRCAHCVNEVTGEQMLDKSSVPDVIRCIKTEPVGRYAVSFTFSDLHASGIYTYDYLRALCPCVECLKNH